MSKEEIREAMEQYLDDTDITYEVTKSGNLAFPIGLGKTHPFSTLNFLVIIRDTRMLTLCTCPIHAEEEKRDDMAEFLTRANYGLSLGDFEMDYDDGEIQYKMALDLEGDEAGTNVLPTHEQMANVIGLSASMFRKYGKGILSVSYGGANPKEACENCEKDD